MLFSFNYIRFSSSFFGYQSLPVWFSRKSGQKRETRKPFFSILIYAFPIFKSEARVSFDFFFLLFFFLNFHNSKGPGRFTQFHSSSCFKFGSFRLNCYLLFSFIRIFFLLLSFFFFFFNYRSICVRFSRKLGAEKRKKETLTNSDFWVSIFEMEARVSLYFFFLFCYSCTFSAAKLPGAFPQFHSYSCTEFGSFRFKFPLSSSFHSSYFP